MNENSKKELIKYLKPSAAGAVVCGCVSLFLLICILIYLIGNSNEITTALLGLGIPFVVCTFFVVFYFLNISAINKKINEIEQQGELYLLLNDFCAGGKAFDDRLRLGQKFLIGRKTGTIISYQDIARIYQYIHKTNGVEDMRYIRAVTPDEEIVDLCKIPLRGKADNEVMQVFDYITRMNNRVAVGYID